MTVLVFFFLFPLFFVRLVYSFSLSLFCTYHIRRDISSLPRCHIRTLICCAIHSSIQLDIRIFVLFHAHWNFVIMLSIFIQSSAREKRSSGCRSLRRYDTHRLGANVHVVTHRLRDSSFRKDTRLLDKGEVQFRLPQRDDLVLLRHSQDIPSDFSLHFSGQGLRVFL